MQECESVIHSLLKSMERLVDFQAPETVVIHPRKRICTSQELERIDHKKLGTPLLYVRSSTTEGASQLTNELLFLPVSFLGFHERMAFPLKD